MNHRQYQRLRQWDLRTRTSYNAGFLDGTDMYLIGYDRPPDPDDDPKNAPFDINFYVRPRKRYEQWIVNSNIARQRGAVDGWDRAKEQADEAEREDAILTEAEEGIARLERYLSERRAA